MVTIFKCCGGQRGPYTLISIDKIILLLKERHGTLVKRRWVFQCIKDMLIAGYISRKTRHFHKSDGTIGQISSIIAITLKGAKFLVSKQVSGAFLLLKNILAWIKNKDRRFPNKAESSGSGRSQNDPVQDRRLKEMLEGIGEPFPA
jgi:hypothetical protein